MVRSDLFRLKSMWGNYSFNYVEAHANGRSGGVLSLWDPSSFVKSYTYSFDNFIVVKGTWMVNNCNCYMVNVYAPQSESDKLDLWAQICGFMQAHEGKYLICGDFNSVRCRDDRMGSLFSAMNARNFNEFIDNGKLIDVAMGRHKFTRLSLDGLKGSRIDRFLVNQEFLDSFNDITMEALDDMISDHRPLLLKQQHVDFGPTPFKFYNSWMNLEDFEGVLKDSWNKADGKVTHSAFVRLKNKLKLLKTDVKIWRKEKNTIRNSDHINKDIADLDQRMISNGSDSGLADQRKNVVVRATGVQQLT
uniref:uncharacterized protein LOC122595278 n=1 Tax=Erigeron canadensis TaxID=72917 RepID=UPI001CB8EDC1|nr:uncharacterized protein LOC122595278 [Erigeron canadensis]